MGTLLSEQFAEFVRQRMDTRGNHTLSHYNLLESL